jgi:F-type H+-transporting ATPase subunit b
MRTLIAVLLVSTLGTSASAKPSQLPESHGVPAEHGAEASEHGAPAAEHGAASDGAHHADYTGDHDGDHTPNWRDGDSPDYVLGNIGQHVFNLTLLVAFLVYVGRRPVLDAVKNRALGIRKEITDAARLRDEAKQRHEELSARLSGFEEEVRTLRADAEIDAKVEEQKLIERAHEEAKRIGQIAERNIRDELVRARVALRKDAVDLAVKLAEQVLRSEVEPEDQRRLARQFLESLHSTNRDEVNGNG